MTAARQEAAGAGPPDGAPVPGWLAALARAAGQMPVPPPLRPPPSGGRRSAVLILFGEGDGVADRAGTAGSDTGGLAAAGAPDVLLLQRAERLRRHAGQPAFPGGAIDPADDGPVGAALRESAEEARVDPAGVQVLAVLPELYIWRSEFLVTPVLAWWRRPGPVAPGDPAEVSLVARVPVAELADPANRLSLRYPSGLTGPAFRAGGMLIWGFTALLLDRLVALGGWERPWDATHPQDLGTGMTGAIGRYG